MKIRFEEVEELHWDRRSVQKVATMFVCEAQIIATDYTTSIVVKS